ncbi:hypothetical protein [Polynucleobacter necessarius]|uniref:hypothetical protein n=1 Tax=Polynucleobacter necessarius TaxID=576610 RepID=UPI0018D50C68|nr:hypothetical protein [Polynucleobacter necessarius]
MLSGPSQLMEVLADFGAVFYFGVQTFLTGIFKVWLAFSDRLAAVQLALGLLRCVLQSVEGEKILRFLVR